MKTKIVLVVLAVMMALSSCVTPKNLLRGYRPIKDYGEQMILIKNHFPEVYDLYRNGAVIINEVYTYEDKEGHPQVHISYSYRNGGRY